MDIKFLEKAQQELSQTLDYYNYKKPFRVFRVFRGLKNQKSGKSTENRLQDTF